MLFFLKKFVSFWMMPYSVGLTAIMVGLWLTRWPARAKLGRALAIAGAVLLLVFGNHFVSRVLIRPLEVRYAPIPEIMAGTPLPPALVGRSYVVVLGGGNGHTAGAAAMTELSHPSRARIVEAVRLLRALPEARLVVSGPGDGKRRTHAEVLARAAMSLGVDRSRIDLIDQGLDTEDEARLIAEKIGQAPAALVTSAWHMPRAMALFHHRGLTPLAAPADFVSHDHDSFSFNQLLWDTRALDVSTWAIRERVGYLWIALRGKT